MRNLSILFAGLFTLALAFSCQPKKQDTTAGKPVSLETRTIQQNKGTDCDKQPDTLRTDCAIIDISVPKIQEPSALSKSVEAWVDKFLIHLLIYSDYPEENPLKAQKTVDAAIKRFHAIHDEAKGSVASGQFKVMCSHSALLNDGKYLTLFLDGYSFQGGNHHLAEVGIATFDVKTGKQLTWTDLVKDQKALLPIAQAKVQETRADAFKEGFSFDKEEPFALPAAYGLTADGLLMHYSPDEIYQLGGSTAFTISYSELGASLKLTAPASSPVTEAPTKVEEEPEDTTKTSMEGQLVVHCSERGNISFNGKPAKDLDELKSLMRPAVKDLLKTDDKTMPEISTDGCLMGMQGAIRDMYEELKNELQSAGKKPTETTAPVGKSTNTTSPKTERKPVPASKTTTTKPAPTITLNEKSGMTLNGKKVATFEDLRKQLQPILLTYDVIPNDVPIKTSGTTGMGTRAEMRTEISAAIAGAKWLRKKAAIAAVTAIVSKKMGTEVELVVGNYQTSGNFAYFDARPNKNTSKADAPSSKLEDKVIALLRYSKGAWKVLDYKIGVNAAPVDAWVKTYKAPKGMFTKK